MHDWFRLGGWGMWPTLLFGLLTIAVSLRYATRPERRVVPLLVSLNAMTLLAGALGFVTGLIMSCLAIDRVGASERFIVVIGLGESLCNMALALLLMSLGALAAVVGAWRLSRLPPALLPAH